MYELIMSRELRPKVLAGSVTYRKSTTPRGAPQSEPIFVSFLAFPFFSLLTARALVCVCVCVCVYVCGAHG